jgi:hypothetical protein
MKKIAVISICAALAGCVTLSGVYTVVARDPATGTDIPGPRIIAQGSGIYTARNALCASHPKAVIVITDAKTGEELKSESPYKCN